MKQFIEEVLLFIKFILCIFYCNLLQSNIFEKINSQVTPYFCQNEKQRKYISVWLRVKNSINYKF